MLVNVAGGETRSVCGAHSGVWTLNNPRAPSCPNTSTMALLALLLALYLPGRYLGLNGYY